MSTSFLAYTEAEIRERDLERTTRTVRPEVPAQRRRHQLAERIRRVADAIDT
jgi:hypothetical protein